ncbi:MULTISPECIES: hypothetical protein [Helicobacter]|nr:MULTISPECIES: hypothetical protein [Helicobacter]
MQGYRFSNVGVESNSPKPIQSLRNVRFTLFAMTKWNRKTIESSHHL